MNHEKDEINERKQSKVAEWAAPPLLSPPFLSCISSYSWFLSFVIALLQQGAKRVFSCKTSGVLHRPVLFRAGKQGALKLARCKNPKVLRSRACRTAQNLLRQKQIAEMQCIAGPDKVKTLQHAFRQCVASRLFFRVPFLPHLLANCSNFFCAIQETRSGIKTGLKPVEMSVNPFLKGNCGDLSSC